MTDLLTREEYAAIAAQINFPKSAFIDGKYKPGSGDKLDTANPATGEKLATIAACNADDVDLAVSKARVRGDTITKSKAVKGRPPDGRSANNSRNFLAERIPLEVKRASCNGCCSTS